MLHFSAELLTTFELPSGYVARPLSSEDYQNGHFDVLAELTTISDVGESAWLERFHEQVSIKNTYYTIVIIDSTNQRIVATGTVFAERKFIRGLGVAGHIEDIAVSKTVQGKGFGKILIQMLTKLSENIGCYKVRLL